MFTKKELEKIESVKIDHNAEMILGLSKDIRMKLILSCENGDQIGLYGITRGLSEVSFAYEQSTLMMQAKEAAAEFIYNSILLQVDRHIDIQKSTWKGKIAKKKSEALKT